MDGCDETFMRRALELALKGCGHTAPNPMVGAVLVRGGEIIGEGWHTRDGAPHAEVECLRDAARRGNSPVGATMYVTLEPCTTHGRTGACSRAIAEAGVSSVKIGAVDPNPLHSGRAGEVFARAGIACEFGILKDECERLNFIYNYCTANGGALLAIKYAVSADGKLTSERGRRERITGAAAIADLMERRKMFSSIGVGSGTLLADNPRLTSRIAGEGGVAEGCGLRLVFDSGLSLACRADLREFHAFSDAFAGNTFVVCSAGARGERAEVFERMGIGVMRIGADYAADPAGFWTELKERLYSMRISSLMVEGGARVFASICAGRAADYAFEYASKNVLGRGLDAFEGGKNFDIVPDGALMLPPDSLKYGKVVYRR